jgi:phage FluMu protein Com
MLPLPSQRRESRNRRDITEKTSMPIENCPKCGKAARVPDSDRALRVKCPHCETLYNVPAAAPPTAEVAPAPEPTRAAPRPTAPEPDRSVFAFDDPPEDRRDRREERHDRRDERRDDRREERQDRRDDRREERREDRGE